MLRKKHYLFVYKKTLQYTLRAVIWQKIAEVTLKNRHSQDHLLVLNPVRPIDL